MSTPTGILTLLILFVSSLAQGGCGGRDPATELEALDSLVVTVHTSQTILWDVPTLDGATSVRVVAEYVDEGHGCPLEFSATLDDIELGLFESTRLDSTCLRTFYAPEVTFAAPAASTLRVTDGRSTLEMVIDNLRVTREPVLPGSLATNESLLLPWPVASDRLVPETSIVQLLDIQSHGAIHEQPTVAGAPNSPTLTLDVPQSLAAGTYDLGFRVDAELNVIECPPPMDCTARFRLTQIGRVAISAP